MASSQLTTEYRNKLYFKKYKYRASLDILGIRYSYSCDTMADYLARIDRIKRYHKQYLLSMHKIESIDFISMEKFFNWKKVHGKQVTVRMECNSVGIFSNDLECLKTLEDQLSVPVKYSEVILTEEDAMYFKREPKFKFRVYLKPVRASAEFIESMISFIDRNSENENINFSPALKDQILQQKPDRYIHGSYFIEYNEESTLSLLYLMFPRSFSKSYRLLKDSKKDKYSNKMEYLDGQNS